MAVFTKNVTGGTWTTTTLWSPTGYPGQNGATDQALWLSTGSGISVANATLGQIRADSLTVSPIIANVAGQVLTLSPAGSYSGVGIRINNTTSTSFNLSVNGAIKINESQSFSVYAGNTLNVGGVVSSTNATDVLTKADTGTLALSGANTFGGSGGGFVASAGLTTASNAGSFGNVANTVTVSSGASVFVSGVTPAQSGITIAGTGVLSYGALYVNSAWTAAKTITLTGSNVMMSLGNAAGYAAKLTGTITGDLILNCPVNPSGASLSSTTSDFTVDSGKYIRVRGVNVTTSVPVANAALGLGTFGDSIGLGNSTNKIYVEATAGIGKVDANATGAATRDYFFVGQATYGANEVGTTYAIDVSPGPLCNLNFTGTITGTSGYYVKSYGGASNFGGLTFSGKLEGAWNLTASIVSVGNTVLTLNTGLDVSSWTGTTVVRDIVYGVSPSGPLILDTNSAATIDSLDSVLVVSHSGYSRLNGTAQTFVGTNNLTLTGGPWASAPGTWTVSANTLTLGFNFNVTNGTLTKAGAGTLALSGDNTSVTAVSWSAGNLTLNSAGSVGTGSTALTQTSTGVLDNTSGGDVNLTATGAWSWGANFTWNGGTGTLYRNSNVTYVASRVITFVNGKSGTLKIGGTIGNAAAVTLTVGSVASVGTTSRLWVVGGNLSTLTTAHNIYSGYYRISSNNGLGAAASNVGWYVNNGASLELYGGVTTPSNKPVALIGSGVNNDGALCGLGGNNTFLGFLYSDATGSGGRIRADGSGNTFTLSDSAGGTIGNNGTNAPLLLDATATNTLAVERAIESGITNVTCGNNGSGRVELSRANSFIGLLLCSTGTTALKNVSANGNAFGTGTTISATAILAVEVPTTYKATFPGTTTLGSSASKAYFRIGA